MKTTSTFPLPTLLRLLLILGQFPIAATGDVEVSEAGVYIITMICDPDNGTQARSILRINDQDTIFVAYGNDSMIAGLSVALPFNVGDTIGLRLEGDQKRSNFSLGVALASTSKKNFTTVHSDGYVYKGNISIFQDISDPKVRSEYVHNIGFYQCITESGSWSDYNAKILSFDIPRDGVYWVMVRPRGSRGAMVLIQTVWVRPDPLQRAPKRRSKKGLFYAYLASSTSGAVYLTTSQTVSMNMVARHYETEDETMLSFVYLEGNTPQKLSGTHMAVTAHVFLAKQTYSYDENVAFNGRSLDRGNMYATSNKEFSISINGSYILSLCVHPFTGQNLQLQVYRNDQVAFTSFSRSGVSSGQSGVFNFKKGDKLYVRARDSRAVGSHTMISIALLYKE